MNQITYNINTEFISDFKEFKGIIPKGYIDKTICGCGLTTIAIENNRNTIIAVPNTELIHNKLAQYPNKRCNHNILGIYAGITKDKIMSYIAQNELLKIIVTYDSLWKIESFISECDLIIDESQELLLQCGLKLSDKKDSEQQDVLTYLFKICEQYKEKVSFVSATPIHVDYLPKFIKELPQIKFEFNDTQIVKPYLFKRGYPLTALKREIIKPLLDKGYIHIKDIRANKVIIFVNSIKYMKNIIDEFNISLDDVAVIVGKTSKNDIRLHNIKRISNPYKLPKFTFITSSGYKGIDLYDDTAINIVVSLSTKNYTMVDMKTDLKQAVSRQRNKNNPNYGKYIFIYNQNLFDTEEKILIDNINEVENIIKEAIELYELAKKENKKKAFNMLSKNNQNFVHYTIYDETTDTYKINDLAFNADKYFILETRKSYQKGFTIQKSLNNSELVVQDNKINNDIKFEHLVDYFRSNHKKGIIEWREYSKKVKWINIIEMCYKLYNKVYKNQVYSETMIKNFNANEKAIIKSVSTLFAVGNRYSRKLVKDKLNRFYKDNNIKRTAKHTDIYEYFNLTEVTVRGERYIEILNRK